MVTSTYVLQNGQFGVEACGPTVLPDQKWQKVSTLKNSNETFWMIFKHCERRRTEDEGVE